MNHSAWTPEQIEYLRANVGTLTYAQIGAAIGRTAKAVNSYSKRHGFTFRRLFTDEEKQFVIDHAKTHTAAWVAAQLNRSLASIYQLRDRLGLTTPNAPLGEAFAAFLKEKHALGWSDAEIAEAWGCERHTVGDHRKKHGLSENTFSQHRRDKVRQKTREQLKAAGLPTLAAVRAKAFRDRARSAGWPDDLRPRHVQILNTLWDNGPMTRLAIAKAIGARTDFPGPHPQRRVLHSNDPEGSYLAHLIARGLLVTLGRRARGKGKGKSVFIYSLPLTIQRKVPNAHE